MHSSWLQRWVALSAAAILAGVALVLGWIAIVAARRSEGVFLPAGYVAIGCGAGSIALARRALRS